MVRYARDQRQIWYKITKVGGGTMTMTAAEVLQIAYTLLEART